jgi:L-ascorbate metabolism protein UlaG (beta-lactamase superfamily)
MVADHCPLFRVAVSGKQRNGGQNMKNLTTNIYWLGHDSFRIDGDGVVVYIDPYRLKEGPKADSILITHDHSDHASMADVAMIQKADTIIVTTAAAA